MGVVGGEGGEGGMRGTDAPHRLFMKGSGLSFCFSSFFLSDLLCFKTLQIYL